METENYNKEINKILKSGNENELLMLFQFDREISPDLLVKKFRLWILYFFPRLFKDKEAPFHLEMDLRRAKLYLSNGGSFLNIAFRGSAKTARAKAFRAFVIANDKSHYRKYFRILSKDVNNATQSVTDIYNMLVSSRVKALYPNIFEKTISKREETMSSFTTSFGVKMIAKSILPDQRGNLQGSEEISRPDFDWYDDFETRATLMSAVVTNKIIVNMEECRTGLEKNGASEYTANYISELGSVHQLVEKIENKMIVPIIENGIPTWDRFTIEDINEIKNNAEDFEGEYLCLPSASRDIYFDRETLDKMEVRQPIKDIAGFKIFRDYNPSHRYAGGMDVAGGVGLDSSASVFIDFSTIPAQVVGTYKSNTIAPEAFGNEIYEEANRFGGCIVAPENNKFDQTILKAKQLGAKIYRAVKGKTLDTIHIANPKYLYGWNTNGLSLTIDTDVLTPNGWRKIGNIAVGDKVMGSNGKPTEVLGVYPQGKLKVWNLQTSDGATIECSGDHLWPIKSKYYKNARHRILKTRELKADKNKMFIPLCLPINFEKQELPINPYVLGLLLGDGSFGKSIMFTTNDIELVSQISKELPISMSIKKSTGKYGYLITGDRSQSKLGQNDWQKKLTQLGLRDTRSHNKFIPQIYKQSSIDDRLAILRGLMDTDGCAVGHSSSKFNSISKQLAEDVRDIVLSLGGYANIKFYKNDFNGNYEVLVSLKENPFGLERKAKRYGTISRNRRRNITSVNETDFEKEMVCIKVSATDELFVIKDYLLTHNTKSKMMADLRKACNDGYLVLNDKDLITEAKSYTRNDLIDSNIDPRDVNNPTRHWDLLTACAIAFQLKDHAEAIEISNPSFYEIKTEETLSTNPAE